MGKAVDKPVYELLGGKVRERIRSYTYIYPRHGSAYGDNDETGEVYSNPDMAAERAVGVCEPGLHGAEVRPRWPLHRL